MPLRAPGPLLRSRSRLPAASHAPEFDAVPRGGWRAATRPRVLAAATILIAAVAQGCSGTGDAVPAGDRSATAADAGAASGIGGSILPDPQISLEECLEGAYLCRGLSERDEARITRWADGTSAIRIHVPRPEIPDAGAARRIQDAAVAGLRAWHEQPFPLVVERSGQASGADFTLRWVRRLEGTELGRTGTQWNRASSGATSMRVQDLVLVLENPFAPGRLRTPDEIRLTAAHEMGHALGLPHSDSPRDVMYPTNTSTALSARDYSAMTALYRTENGALVSAEVLAQLDGR